MFTLPRWYAPKRARMGSSIRLRLESLEYRDHPDGLLGDPPSPLPPSNPPPVLIPPPMPPANVAPTISNFNAEETGNGFYIISGQVTDEHPDGMFVTLGGSTSAAGKIITVQSDGSFSCIVQLATDGTETGTISARTVDDHGVASNEMYVLVSPTPP